MQQKTELTQEMILEELNKMSQKITNMQLETINTNEYIWSKLEDLWTEIYHIKQEIKTNTI